MTKSKFTGNAPSWIVFGRAERTRPFIVGDEGVHILASRESTGVAMAGSKG